jgi:hypothetical protein
MANTKTEKKSKRAKKEFKKMLAGKIESALPEIKTRLGEKKFQRRIKKAAKLFVQGLDDKDFSENGNKQATGIKKIRKIKTQKVAIQIAPADNITAD